MKEIKKIDMPVMVSRLKNGDQHAFSALYEYFFSKIYFSSKKMFLPHEDAEGVAQEVFLIIWKKKECLDPDLCFHSYLITIMRSLIFKRTKKEARRIAYQKYGIREDFEISTETEDGLVYKEIEQFSINIIEKLPNGQKEVFLLKSYQHLSAG
jgi:RNA polymerase sigma-70 factor (ECF subfamily)